MATDERLDDLVLQLRELARETSREAQADLAKVHDLLQRARRRRADRAVKRRMVEFVQVLAAVYQEVVDWKVVDGDLVLHVMRRELRMHEVAHLCLGCDEIRALEGAVEAARERVGTFGIELVQAGLEAGMFEDPDAVCDLLSDERDTRHPNSLLSWAKKIDVGEAWREVAGARAFWEFAAADHKAIRVRA